MIDPQLSGKVAFITGANHGIGAAAALALAEQGASIFVTYYRPLPRFTAEEHRAARRQGIGGAQLYEANQQQNSRSVIEHIRSLGVKALAQEADLANAAAIPHLFDVCESRLGPVDILVTNHTHCVQETFDPALACEEGFPVRLVSADEIDRHMQINARACALLMREYVQRYLARGARWGRIINISADAAHAHTANVSYAASKHAIESYTRSAAAELGKYGITVNNIAPGPIQTGYITPEGEADIAHGTPLGRIGQPRDVADVIVYLASEQARWLTGQLLYVGGGWRIPQ
ncbi:MAG: SDR family oxidoreductase [Chloroflexi bacterium]|nr:SDR family oxidoreductase [Chloroflexota bacterium]